VLNAVLWLVVAAADAPKTLVVIDPSLDKTKAERAFAGPALVPETPRDDELEGQKKLIALAFDSLKAARNAALELRTDEAIQKFEEAQNLFGRGVAALDDFTPMAQGLLELGAAFMDKGKDDKATQAFRRALALSTGSKPDPKQYAPNVLQRFAKVERDVQRAERGSMTIVSKPESADVFFDGRKVGVTPVSLNDLVLGEHWVSIRLAGHHRFSARVLVSKERVEKTEVFLRPLQATAMSPLTQAFLSAKSGRLDKNAAQEALGESKYVAIVLVTSKSSALYFDRKLGEQTLTGASLEDIAARMRALQQTPQQPQPQNLQPAVTKPPPISEPRAESSTAPIVVKEATRTDVHPAVALLPLGIGQFMERRHGWGAFFLTTQIVFLTANILSFWLVQADKVPGTNPAEFRNPQRSEALKWVSNIGFGLLIADVIAGGIDGLLHRKAN
jgi:hypothetical protein